ncbi:hypothetical protein KUTeg_008313 [Tegillarca granosa]|uniref:Uncharacterized protein n=1 Tax=Tegillarca granosa TaxID=220873 RepID=A0ABQ9FD18_TEGGR|nr:hypothetical protein KUTeg_008313 [Tegillarca granosa]
MSYNFDGKRALVTGEIPEVDFVEVDLADCDSTKPAVGSLGDLDFLINDAVSSALFKYNDSIQHFTNSRAKFDQTQVWWSKYQCVEHCRDSSFQELVSL